MIEITDKELHLINSYEYAEYIYIKNLDKIILLKYQDNYIYLFMGVFSA